MGLLFMVLIFERYKRFLVGRAVHLLGLNLLGVTIVIDGYVIYAQPFGVAGLFIPSHAFLAYSWVFIRKWGTRPF